MTVKMITDQTDRYAELEKELQYFKEMYEIEKETNELNEIKLAELNSLNAQDLKKHEREKLELQAKLRRLENATNMQRTNDTANAVFRQRIQQLELEVTSLTDRVRIAENMATKLEEDCRAKDFKIREQQKEYDICLSKCNALELMLMSNSQMDNSISINSVAGDHGDGSEGLGNTQTQDYIDKHSPNTDTTCDTVPDSPINSRAELKHTENSPYSLQLNGHDRNSNCTSNFQLNGFFVSLPEFVDVNVARNFCQQHPNSIDGLLKLAEMIRTIRNENHVLKTSISLDGVGRTPLAVLTGKDKVKDLQRLLAELNCRPNA
ncbi:hypothetical protein M3Y96_00897000 [Aphelenchoides besseyi]|nr:hypothetical protein M3Y96_00897000 [Aphelenchoides besseyi]